MCIRDSVRNAWLKDGREKKPAEVWEKSQYRNLNIDAKKIEDQSELNVINYADLFLYGLPTGTIFDKYQEDISDYRKRNDKLLDQFAEEFL